MGPVDLSHLVRLVLSLEVPEVTLVWRRGLAEWTPARNVPEISVHIPPPPPTPPPTEPQVVPAATLDPAADPTEELGRPRDHYSSEDRAAPRRRKRRRRGGGDEDDGDSRMAIDLFLLGGVALMLVLLFIRVLWSLMG